MGIEVRNEVTMFPDTPRQKVNFKLKYMNALTPDEVAVVQMALGGMIEDLEAARMNPNYPFTPQSRRDMNDILSNSKSALAKIALASGKLLKLDPYQEGDEKDFLTKQS